MIGNPRGVPDRPVASCAVPEVLLKLLETATEAPGPVEVPRRRWRWETWL